jgi:hypothetical protein
MLDSGVPLSGRFLRGLDLCGRLEALEADERTLGLLQRAVSGTRHRAPGEIGPPDREAARSFRETVFEYLSADPRVNPRRAIRGRIVTLRQAMAFSRGKGPVPRVVPDQPETTFEALELPQGELEEKTRRPIDRCFEASAASRQYAMTSRNGWPIVESFRALALAYAIALWMLRLKSATGPPRAEQAVEVVSAIEWGHADDALIGRYHRRRVRRLARLGELERLVAWYAR